MRLRMLSDGEIEASIATACVLLSTDTSGQQRRLHRCAQEEDDSGEIRLSKLSVLANNANSASTSLGA
jgi:hypothetical protein